MIYDHLLRFSDIKEAKATLAVGEYYHKEYGWNEGTVIPNVSVFVADYKLPGYFVIIGLDHVVEEWKKLKNYSLRAISNRSEFIFIAEDMDLTLLSYVLIEPVMFGSPSNYDETQS